MEVVDVRFGMSGRFGRSERFELLVQFELFEQFGFFEWFELFRQLVVVALVERRVAVVGQLVVAVGERK